jgi:hypothetical protein
MLALDELNEKGHPGDIPVPHILWLRYFVGLCHCVRSNRYGIVYMSLGGPKLLTKVHCG